MHTEIFIMQTNSQTKSQTTAAAAAAAAALVAAIDLPSSRADHYGALGVASTSTKPQIRHAYRDMALLFHPDKCEARAQSLVPENMPNRGDVVDAVTELLKPIHDTEMSVLNTAVETLTDADKRAQYDADQATASSSRGAFASSGHDASAFSGQGDPLVHLMEAFLAQGLDPLGTGTFVMASNGSFVKQEPSRGRRNRRRDRGTAAPPHAEPMHDLDEFLDFVEKGGSGTFTSRSATFRSR